LIVLDNAGSWSAPGIGCEAAPCQATDHLSARKLARGFWPEDKEAGRVNQIRALSRWRKLAQIADRSPMMKLGELANHLAICRLHWIWRGAIWRTGHELSQEYLTELEAAGNALEHYHEGG